MSTVKPIPDGFHSLTPHIIVKGCAEAIEFYKKAFGATELWRNAGPDGNIFHAEVKIGNSILMLCDEFPQMKALSPISVGNTSTTIHLYVEDADKAFEQAKEAGATVVMPVSEMFWGDRYGMLKDPFGHSWSVATHVKDLTPAEVEKAAAEAMAQGCEHSEHAHEQAEAAEQH